MPTEPAPDNVGTVRAAALDTAKGFGVDPVDVTGLRRTTHPAPADDSSVLTAGRTGSAAHGPTTLLHTLQHRLGERSVPTNPGLVPDLDSLPLFTSLPPTPPLQQPPNPAPQTEPASSTPRTPDYADIAGTAHAPARNAVDWAMVRMFRKQAADQLATQLGQYGTLDRDAQRELGRSIVTDLLNTYSNEALIGAGQIFSATEQQALNQAVMDALFGLGRLQPLVDMGDVENIEIYGADRTWLEFSNGRVETGDPVADTDNELIGETQFIAARSEGTERAFSPESPTLHMRLDDGSRLAASAWITPRPLIVIRRHRLKRATLSELSDGGLMSANVAAFLDAAVKARKSIVIAGAQGAGKTTLLRALAAAVPPTEHIATVETEYELHLHELTDRHPRCSAWEARPGSGERRADGSRAGEVTLDDILYDSFRFNLARLFVGEVRGKEILAMFKAMQAAAGSMSTTHAYSARAAVERLVTCAMEAGAHVTEQFAYRQVAEHVDIIVHIKLDTTPVDEGVYRRERYISQIIAIEQGERSGIAITDLYKPGPDGRAEPHDVNEEMRELIRYGFDATQHTGSSAA